MIQRVVHVDRVPLDVTFRVQFVPSEAFFETIWAIFDRSLIEREVLVWDLKLDF